VSKHITHARIGDSGIESRRILDACIGDNGTRIMSGLAVGTAEQKG